MTKPEDSSISKYVEGVCREGEKIVLPKRDIIELMRILENAKRRLKKALDHNA